MDLDQKDIEILRLVQDDGRMPQAEIGRRVGLSAAAVCERLKKLEHRRIITGYSARVDPARVHCAMTPTSYHHPTSAHSRSKSEPGRVRLPLI